MNKFTWYKTNEDKEICDIIFNSTIMGRLVVERDILNKQKWMCYFYDFPYPQLFCFEDKMFEMHNLYNKDDAKKMIENRFKKIVHNFNMFFSEISKNYCA